MATCVSADLAAAGQALLAIPGRGYRSLLCTASRSRRHPRRRQTSGGVAIHDFFFMRRKAERMGQKSLSLRASAAIDRPRGAGP